MANPENKQIPYESTQKDIRDAIESVATAIGGIAIPSADHVSYDNSGSGLSATDVQNALDEIVSDIPTVNNGTLTIQQNGTSKGSFTANSASNVNVNIETPTADKKTATTEFNTADGGLLSKCVIDLVPVQSGSGDPYPAGGGKNKLPLTLDTIKEAMNYVTWTGNSTVVNNVTFTVLEDDAGNVSGIKANGTASATIYFVIAKMSQMTWVKNTSIIINGCPTGGGASTYELMFYIYNGSNSARDFGEGSAEFTPTEDTSLVQIVIRSGVTVSNIVFYPMIRLASVTDPTFAPYSNVRAISGHTEAQLYNVGKNLCSGVEDGGVTDYGTTESSTIRCRSIDYIPVKPNTQYTFKALASGGVLQYIIRTFYDDNNTYKESDNGGWHSGAYSFTTSNDVHFVKIIFSYTSHTAISASNIYDAQLEKGNQATSYEPYLGHLYTINLGGTYYGGYLDVVSGEFVATHASETITSMEYYGTYGVDNAPLFYKDLTNTYVQYGSATAPIANKPISNAYRAISVNDATQLKNNEFRTQQVDTPNRYYFRDDRYNSKAQMDAWLSDNPVQVCGKLATPLTIRLTPQMIETLAGQNNLSCPLSGQSIETNGVEYKELFTFADVKEYVDKKIPDAPTTDGTYTLQAVVSGGVPTYSWV